MGTPTRHGLQLDKYTVIRNRESYALPIGTEALDPEEVFVLKRGDALAVSALRSYVQNILLLLDLDKDMRRDGRPDILTSDERGRLGLLADDVNELAELWERYNHGKLPD